MVVANRVIGRSDRFQRRLSSQEGRAMASRVNREVYARFCGRLEVKFLRPTRRLTLAEAMAAGCVPVASAIRGVTDVLIDHGRTGLLFPVGDLDRAAEEIRRIVAESGLLERLAAAAKAEAASRFDSDRAAGAYAGLLRTLRGDPPAIAEPLPLHRWRYPRGLADGALRRFIPRRVKNLLREIRERIAVASVSSGTGRPGERP